MEVVMLATKCVTNAERETTLCVTVPRLTLIGWRSVSIARRKDINPKIAHSPESGKYVDLVGSAARKPTIRGNVPLAVRMPDRHSVPNVVAAEVKVRMPNQAVPNVVAAEVEVRMPNVVAAEVVVLDAVASPLSLTPMLNQLVKRKLIKKNLFLKT